MVVVHADYTSSYREHLAVVECASGSENATKGTTGQPIVSISRFFCHIFWILSNRRVSGICFQLYTSTLEEKVNPRHLCKSDFLSSSRLFVDDAIKAYLDGILAGIRHLHSLSIIYNDITPSNIIFKEDGTLVINDFGSYRRVGQPLEGTQRTHG